MPKRERSGESAAKKEAKKLEKETAPNPDNAATKLQKVMRGKITRNKISNEIGQIETQIAGIENQVQKASKQESKRLKKKASQPQSTTDFLNMTFTPPKRDIVQMLTPHKVSNVETERPLYDQIVQQEIIELHKLKTLIESKGGKVTDLNTDAITCTFSDNKLPFELHQWFV